MTMANSQWLLRVLAFSLTVCLLTSGGGAAAGTPWLAEAPHGVCPTQTTPLPMPVTLTVTLQRPNSPPPHAAWAVPVTFALYPPGDSVTVCHQWDVVLDQNGQWSGWPDLFTGTYDARIRNLHTLRNVKRNVVIAGPVTINMGTLLEGDANADNSVNILDFARLRNSYFLDEGMPGFDPTTDFDERENPVTKIKSINILDFGLLRGSYFMDGDIAVSALLHSAKMPATSPVTITLAPRVRDLGVAEVVEFSVQVDATGQPLLGLDVELFYRTLVVAVTDATGTPVSSLTPGSAFNVILQNRVDAGNGRILFSAATFDAPVSGSLEIARFYLKGQKTGPGDVRFGPRTIGMDGAYVEVPVVFAQPFITVGGMSNYRLFLPFLSR